MADAEDAPRDPISLTQGAAMEAVFSAFSKGEVAELRLRQEADSARDGALNLRDASGRETFAAQMSDFTAAIPCFTAESRILTDHGLYPVRDLIAGMRVMTRDNGLQEIIWTGRRRFDWRALGLNPLLRPIRIQRNNFV